MLTVQEAMESMRNDLKKMGIKYALYIPFIAVSFGCTFINMWLAVAVLAAGVIYLMIYIRGLKNKFCDTYNDYHIRIGFRENGLEDLTYTRDGGIDQALLKGCRMIPVDEETHSPMQRQHVTGTYKGTQVELSDAIFTSRMKDGGATRAATSVGIWLSVPLECDTGCDWRILHRKAMDEKLRRSYFPTLTDLEKVRLDIEWFDKDYSFYRPVGSDELPSKALLRQLKLLQEFTPGHVCISVWGNQFQAFVQERVMARNISRAKNITEELLKQSPFPELDYLVRMSKLLPKDSDAEEPEDAE